MYFWHHICLSVGRSVGRSFGKRSTDHFIVMSLFHNYWKQNIKRWWWAYLPLILILSKHHGILSYIFSIIFAMYPVYIVSYQLVDFLRNSANTRARARSPIPAIPDGCAHFVSGARADLSSSSFKSNRSWAEDVIFHSGVFISHHHHRHHHHIITNADTCKN